MHHHLVDAWSASIYKLAVMGQVLVCMYNDPKLLVVYGRQAHTLPAS